MHSVVAQRKGIPVKSITLFIFGGVSQISEEPKRPQDEFWIAFAGPLSSIVLGAIFLGIANFLVWIPEYVKAVALYLGFINIILAAFNLIPGFPLDGGRVLRSLIWWKNNNLIKATRIASTIGQGIGFLFIAGGILLALMVDLINGIWIALIGWFLQNAAAGSYRQLALQDMLKGHKAYEVMNKDCNIITPDLTVDKLVSENILANGKRCFLVTSNDRVTGMVTLLDVRSVPREQWHSKNVGEIMVPFDKLRTVSPETELAVVLKIITEDNINQVPVVSGGNVIGMITREHLLNFINLRGELQP